MTLTAADFIKRMNEDFGGEVKAFQKSRGMSAGAASNLNDAKNHLEKSQEHDALAQHHQDQAESNKSQGNHSISSLHSEASGQHQALSAIHTNLASKKLAKSKASQNLGEGLGFGGHELDPESLYKPFDSRRKVDYTPLRPQNQHFTVQDLRRVVETVGGEHNSSLLVLRFDDDNGFLGQVTSGGGMFPGAIPSAQQLEQSFTQRLRAEFPPASCELLDQTSIPPDHPAGHSSRRSVWRFSLKSKFRGQDPAPTS